MPHDPWLDGDPLINRFNADIISVSETSSMARVGSYIEDHVWQLPSSTHVWVSELHRLIQGVVIHSSDSITWMGKLWWVYLRFGTPPELIKLLSLAEGCLASTLYS